MLTVEDFVNILALLNSDRLAIRGNEAIGLAKLQQKLALTIDAARKPKDETNGSDSSGAAQ